ncbi:MAG TPA: hypothetical protein VNN09_08235 [Candidatus Competibacteraceae bacterium]|nr:hypothetical protein [Candidatus Competibacteraceae bacterium]
MEECKSLARRSGGFTVGASPLNGVKLEVGIILLVGLLLLPVVGRVLPSLTGQFLLLAGYGVAGMLWIIHRTRRVLRQVGQQQDDERHGP